MSPPSTTAPTAATAIAGPRSWNQGFIGGAASATSATRFRYPEVVASMTSRRRRGQTPKTTRQAQSTTGAAHSVRCGSLRCATSPVGPGPQKMIFEARST